MSTRAQPKLKAAAHQKVEVHFMKMCSILPYGGALRGLKIGHSIRNHMDPVRWALLDALQGVDDELEDEFDDD